MSDAASFPVRPTKRCLDDLGVRFPPVETPLESLEHPLVSKAQSLPDEVASGGGRRIESLSDRVWFKVKISALRGAGTQLYAHEAVDLELVETSGAWWWLGAGGHRREGSANDFYAKIEAETRRRARSAEHDSDTKHLLPQDVDYKRLRTEVAAQIAPRLRRIVRETIARSLIDGKHWAAELTGHRIIAWVRTRDGDAYLAITAEGFLDPKMIAVILGSVPQVRPEDWLVEPGEVLGIQPGLGELVYSTMIPTETQDAILQECLPHLSPTTPGRSA